MRLRLVSGGLTSVARKEVCSRTAGEIANSNFQSEHPRSRPSHVRNAKAINLIDSLRSVGSNILLSMYLEAEI